jgi:capsular exopolysaccharide synthesis family protein
MQNTTLKKQDDQTAFYARRILTKVVRQWYWFVISGTVAFTLAYLVNRYADRVYPVSGMVYFKTSRDASEDATSQLFGQRYSFWYYNTLVDQQFMLKAYPLIEEVIWELGFNYSFYGEGRVKTTELYLDRPAYIKFEDLENLPSDYAYTFQEIDSSKFKLVLIDEGNTNENGIVYLYGEKVPIGDVYCIFKRNRNKKSNGNNSYKYFLRFHKINSIVESYKNKLNIELSDKEGRSNILKLSTNGTETQKEIDFITKLINKYIEKNLNDKQANANKTIRFIDEQLSLLSDSLALIEEDLQIFKSGNNITGQLSSQGEKILADLGELQNQFAEVDLQLKYFNLISEYINGSYENFEELIVPSTIGISDEVLNSLVRELIKIQRQQQLFIKGKLESNRLTEIKLREFESLKQEIIENLKNQRKNVEIKKKEINNRINFLEKRIKMIPATERRLVNITRQYGFREKLYILLLEKRTETAIKRAAMSADVELLEPPKASGSPITPKSSRNYLVSLSLGLSFPLIIIILLDFLNQKILFKEDIDAITTIPFLGAVSHDQGSDNLSVHNNPKSGLAESFRAIRTNLRFFGNESEKKVIMVTSSLSGEGKTFCTINVGTVYALSGKKTLLIGADLRKPKIYNDFGLTNEIGLSYLLSGGYVWSEVVQETSIKGLSVLSAGPVPPNPSELLLGSKMASLLNELRESYDVIVVDTPPVGLVSDALHLSQLADHTIFVIRQNFTPTATVKLVEEMYQQERLKNISIVLNDVRLKKYGYSYGYGYGYGSGYYEESKSIKPTKRS